MSKAPTYYTLRRANGRFVALELDGSGNAVPVWSSPDGAVVFWGSMPPFLGLAEVVPVRNMSKFVALASAAGTTTIYDLAWSPELKNWSFHKAVHPVEA